MATWARNLVVALLAGGALFMLACTGDVNEAAREHVTRAQGYRDTKQYPAAVIELRRAIQLEPSNGQTRRELADTYTRMEDWANASRESVRAADLLPGDIEAQLSAAELLIIGRRFQDARARADRALAIEPGNVRALLLKGHSAAGLRDLDTAVTEVEDAISLDPGRGLSYANLGQLQWAKGDTSAAAAAFAKAVAIDPASVPAHLARANFEWASGDAAAAEASLRLVLRRDARNLAAHRALALLLIATERMADAGPHLERAAEISSDGRARLALADFYLLSGRTEEGTALLTALGASTDPTLRTPARLRLAVVAGGAGKPQEAARLIEALAQDEPASALALTAQAELRYASGDAAAALHSSQAAVRGSPPGARPLCSRPGLAWLGPRGRGHLVAGRSRAAGPHHRRTADRAGSGVPGAR